MKGNVKFKTIVSKLKSWVLEKKKVETVPETQLFLTEGFLHK